jgi:hypothetical protein
MMDLEFHQQKCTNQWLMDLIWFNDVISVFIERLKYPVHQQQLEFNQHKPGISQNQDVSNKQYSFDKRYWIGI